MKGIIITMVKVENITKYYGKKMAICDISFEAKKGEIVGLLGKNGAGKTTTMNIISGYISSTKGTATVGGYDILANPSEAKALIGYLPEKPPIYMDMTVDEYLDFCAHLKGIDKELRQNHLNEICSLVGINDVRKRLCANLSKGYKQRVGLAQALVGNPEILILDEPTIGLDPNQIIQIRQLIKELGKKHTVIISSHILGEIAQVCQRVIIIDKGKVVASDTLENLTNSLDEQAKMTLRMHGADEKLAEDIGKLENVISVECIGTNEENSYDFMIAYSRGSTAREDIFALATKIKKPILMMKPIETTLEDVFLEVTKDNKGGKR